MTKIEFRIYVPMKDDLKQTKNKIKHICSDELNKLKEFGCKYEFYTIEQLRNCECILKWVGIDLDTCSDCPVYNWKCYWMLDDLVKKANKYIVDVGSSTSSAKKEPVYYCEFCGKHHIK